LLDEVVGNFEDFLSDRKEGQPFFYWWGPWNTHLKWAKGSGKRLWNINPSDMKQCIPHTLPDIPEIREDLTDYLGECVAFDYALGLLIQELDEIGELDNTVIVVSGDHGMGFPRAKCNLYNLGIHVPLVIRYPAGISQGKVLEDFVSLMDLAPTFLDLAQISIPDEMDGISMVNILNAEKNGLIDTSRDFTVSGIERHVASARAGRRPYASRAIIHSFDGRQYKYIRNFRPDRWPMGTFETGFPDLGASITKSWYIDNYCNEKYSYYIDLAFAKRPYEELYDLRNDPYELINYAEDQAFEVLKMRLSKKLDSVLIATGDPRMVDGGAGISLFDRYPYTISY
jgi:arylsulfatase A-like enzyme